MYGDFDHRINVISTVVRVICNRRSYSLSSAAANFPT
jgi:hypothetical protein